jgi:hypothetical protein
MPTTVNPTSVREIERSSSSRLVASAIVVARVTLTSNDATRAKRDVLVFDIVHDGINAL